MADTDGGSGSGQKRAPGRLALVQQFVNSTDLEDGTEQLADPASTAAWLAERGLLAEGHTLRAEDVQRLRGLREALRALALANNGAPLDPAAVAVLEANGRAAPLVVDVGPDGRPVLSPGRPGVDGAVATLLAIVHDATVDGTWARFKACREHTCEWAFYDQSKNRSGAWCVMSVCGNRAKARTYRRRHSESSGG